MYPNPKPNPNPKPREQRLCQCGEDVQTEEHALIKCKMTEGLKVQYDVKNCDNIYALFNVNYSRNASLPKFISTVLSFYRTF